MGLIRVGEIEVSDGMIDDLADHYAADADELDREIKKGRYGYDGGEEKRNDDMSLLCDLRVSAAVMTDYLALRAALAAANERAERAERERDGLRIELRELFSSLGDVERRIGPARLPESIRGDLQSVLNKYRRRAALSASDEPRDPEGGRE